MARKNSWDEKYLKIKAQYPEVEMTSWSSVFSRDIDVFARLLGDMLKADGRGSTPGKRPQVSRADGLEKLNKLAGSDYSELEFHDAFRALSYGLSVRKIANKTNLSKSHIQLLLTEKSSPSFEAMEKIAEGFGKKPTFFLEYRVAKVMALVESFLFDSPETATAWYHKMFGVKR